ncbi:Uma2 family endonuclease [Caloramator australicus]|uniref:Putative restriction endonuclease domain-containing protein n=1 Tax=Caloramator australicus RC3 TaxID=857293 RepID=I7K7J8_9CLOT|nr:Uma2 family endonuclease [Caloramator australicus]CCJ33509.1 hypothetical protein CAAU_1425 [Caloramator australicus RC3]
MKNIAKMQVSYSYKDYLQWDEKHRYELIEGVPYLLASPSVLHQRVVGNIYFSLKNSIKECSVFISPLDVLLVENNESAMDSKNVVQPDVFVVCDESKIKEKYCIGAPDIIVEVVSPSTASKDAIEKFNLYEKFKVKEYWMVRPEEKTVTVFRLENDRYGRPDVYDENGEIILLIENVKIKVKDIFE